MDPGRRATYSVLSSGARVRRGGNPKLLEKRPDSPQVRNSLSKQLAKWVVENQASIRVALTIINAPRWVHENAPAILSYLDSPKALGELQRAALQNSEAPPGYEMHHIVEQEAARRAGFREVLIQGWENRVLIPKYRHHEITGWFMRVELGVWGALLGNTC